MFNISRDTIDRWLNRRKATGSVKAVQGYQRGHSHRIKDWEEFHAFAQQYGDNTQAEMAQLWLGEMSERSLVSCFGTHWLDSKKKTYGYRERTALAMAGSVLRGTSVISPKCNHLKAS